MEVGAERHAPTALPPGMRPEIHCPGVCLSLSAALVWHRKSRPPMGFDLRAVKPVASRYTDDASTADTANSQISSDMEF